MAELVAELVGVLAPEGLSRVQADDDLAAVVALEERDRPAVAARHHDGLDLVIREELPQFPAGRIEHRPDVGFARAEPVRLDAIDERRHNAAAFSLRRLTADGQGLEQHNCQQMTIGKRRMTALSFLRIEVATKGIALSWTC